MAETVRFLYSGDEMRAKGLKGFAANQLGILKNHMAFRGLKQLQRKVAFDDGTQVICQSCFGTNIVSVFVPPTIITRKVVEKKEEEIRGAPVFVFFVGTRTSNRQFLFNAENFTFAEILDSAAKVPTVPARWAVSCKDRLYPGITWIGGHRCVDDEASPRNNRLQFLYGLASSDLAENLYSALHQSETSLNVRGWSTITRDPDYAAGDVFIQRWAYNYKIQERRWRYLPSTGRWATTSYQTIFGPTTDKALYLSKLYELVFTFLPEALPTTTTDASFPNWSPGVVDVVNGNPDILGIAKETNSDIVSTGTRGFAPPWTYTNQSNANIAYSCFLDNFALDVDDYQSRLSETDAMELGGLALGTSLDDGVYYCTRTISSSQTIAGTILAYFAPWDYAAESLVPVPMIGKTLNQAVSSGQSVMGYPNICLLNRETGNYAFYPNLVGNNYTGSSYSHYVATYDNTILIPGLNFPSSLSVTREIKRYDALTDWTSTYNDHGSALRADNSVDTSEAEIDALKRLSLAKAGRATLIFSQKEKKFVPINNTTGRTTRITEPRHNTFYLLNRNDESPTWQDATAQIAAAFRRQIGIDLPTDDTFLGVLTYPGEQTNG